MKQVNVSLDIEACGEVVLSIGACVFDPETGDAQGDFYSVLSIEEQLARGLKMDAGAFLWWLKQSNEARAAITAWNQESVAVALARLAEWMPKKARVWAYPSSFDFPVVARVCATFGVRCPWTWTETMDGRTLWKLALDANPTLEKVESEAGVEHDSLADAKQQARWFAAYLKAIRGEE